MSSLNDFLSGLTVDQLKSLLALIPGAPRIGKKGDLVDALRQHFSGEGLHALWDRLDEVQRQAVAETAYEPDGCFDWDKFEAKYGRLPDFSANRVDTLKCAPLTPLDLFLYYDKDVRGYALPSDIRDRLASFVSEPEPGGLNAVDAPPKRIEEKAVTIRCTEQEAIVDLSVLLRLADQGRIQLSDKTSLPGGATLRLLGESLAGGDFYESRPKQDRFDQDIGPIKAFAWPLLLQAAGFLQRNGAKLGLSPAGLKALSAAPAESLRTIWRKWLSSRLLDEFSRVDAIKGQRSQGRVMSAVAPRRAAIEDALGDCPVGAWIEVDELSRFMRAAGHVFEVTHDPWKLYIMEQQYGSLGYGGSHDWSILQVRYLLCFLFEYAAPLGIIDVAYVDPTGARHDYGHMWGADDLSFLSRYDGLTHVRLTPLGAYCLELCATYTPAAVSRSGVRLSVLPGLRVNVIGGQLGTEEALVLDTWAVKTTDGSWQLDREKALAAVEKGHDAQALLEFLQARDDQPLPIPVEAFAKTCQKNGKALKVSATALLIECQDAETAASIATHKETAALCTRAGERHLVVRLEHEEKFRSLIRILGFGMAV